MNSFRNDAVMMVLYVSLNQLIDLIKLRQPFLLMWEI